jgi:hypothetical protein
MKHSPRAHTRPPAPANPRTLAQHSRSDHTGKIIEADANVRPKCEHERR